MKRCHILVEGQTEETFAKDVPVPHLESRGFHGVSVSILTTKVIAAGPNHKGGVGSYTKIRQELQLLTLNTGCVVTTMVDLYGLPVDTPGIATAPTNNPRQRVEAIESAIAGDIDRTNFVAHVMLHEFETLMFVNPQRVADHFGQPALADILTADVAEAGEPEFVDDGPTTAPSVRLSRHITGYLKSTDGPVIAAEIGLEALRARCPHFDTWLTNVESYLDEG